MLDKAILIAWPARTSWQEVYVGSIGVSKMPIPITETTTPLTPTQRDSTKGLTSWSLLLMMNVIITYDETASKTYM